MGISKKSEKGKQSEKNANYVEIKINYEDLG